LVHTESLARRTITYDNDIDDWVSEEAILQLRKIDPKSDKGDEGMKEILLSFIYYPSFNKIRRRNIQMKLMQFINPHKTPKEAAYFGLLKAYKKIVNDEFLHQIRVFEDVMSDEKLMTNKMQLC
jgi:hypothetical protein